MNATKVKYIKIIVPENMLEISYEMMMNEIKNNAENAKNDINKNNKMYQASKYGIIVPGDFKSTNKVIFYYNNRHSA